MTNKTMLDLESPPNHSHFNLPSGVFVHKWLCDSPRAIVILQHGFAEYAERYVWSHAKLVPTLNAQGFEVWAMDLWGHGRSPGARGVVDVQMAVDDHIQIRHQAATLGLPVFLFGHSLGGLITAASAARDSSPPNDGVVLSSPALPAAMIAPGECALGLLARLMPAIQIPLSRTPVEELCHDPATVSQVYQDDAMYKGQISFLVAATALREARQTWAAVEQWKKPTLVIHGTRDSYTQFCGSERFVREIASVDKTLHLVQGGYHELLNDTDHERTLQVILSFLEAWLG